MNENLIKKSIFYIVTMKTFFSKKDKNVLQEHKHTHAHTYIKMCMNTCIKNRMNIYIYI